MFRTSKTILNNSDENGHPCLVPDFREDRSKMTETDVGIYIVLGLEESIL